MVWKQFKQNGYQVEWYKLSVEKKMISYLPVRIHCQQDFRGSGSRSLNIFDTDLSLVEPVLSIFFSHSYTVPFHLYCTWVLPSLPRRDLLYLVTEW